MKFATILAAAVAVVAIGVSATIAQQDPIAARRAVMKENGAQARVGAAMAKGDQPFNLDAAKKVFATFAHSAEVMPTLFPENSKTGGDTTASPKIWEDMNAFKAAFAKFGADVKAASAKVTDLDSFKAQFTATTKACGGCHETFRVKKS